jgi:hypothetical protein
MEENFTLSEKLRELRSPCGIQRLYVVRHQIPRSAKKAGTATKIATRIPT